MNKGLSLLAAGGLSAALAFLAPRDAHACGGCFAPPIDSTIVTGHRMLLSISNKETTLYDQITYQGNPASFAWVLPIRGQAKIGISADYVFQVLDQSTRTQLQPPPRNCPPPPQCESDRAFGAAVADASASPPTAGGGVTVLAQETVGPYETVQLSATSANALQDWLTSHGYGIPAELEPLIASYVQEGFDFLALKLVPGQGVSSMRPVRITTQGAQPSLPLRMVAAGTGATVGITLWVVAEGRWEPQTFPSFTLPASEITWTWATNSSDIAERRAQKINELGGAAWEIESSIAFGSNNLESAITYGGPYQQLPDGGYGQIDLYDPVLDENGNVVKTSDEVAREDMTALFQGRSLSRLTRMASALPRVSLATDLSLQASNDQSVLPNFRQLTKESDEPSCPVWNGCAPAGNAPRSQAKEKAAASCADGTQPQGGGFCPGSAGSDGCGIGPQGSGQGATAAITAMVALGMIANLRRRRR